MIVEGILNLLKLIITTPFNILPNLPDIPANLSNALNNYLDIIFNYGSLVDVFVDNAIIKQVFPIALILINLSKVYHLLMFVLKKIPMLSIE